MKYRLFFVLCSLVNIAGNSWTMNPELHVYFKRLVSQRIKQQYQLQPYEKVVTQAIKQTVTLRKEHPSQEDIFLPNFSAFRQLLRDYGEYGFAYCVSRLARTPMAQIPDLFLLLKFIHPKIRHCSIEALVRCLARDGVPQTELQHTYLGKCLCKDFVIKAFQSTLDHPLLKSKKTTHFTITHGKKDLDKEIRHMAFSPNGKCFAVASGKNVCIIDTAHNTSIKSFAYNDLVSYVALSGDLLASAAGNRIYIQDIAKDTIELSISTNVHIDRLAFSPNREYIVFTSGSTGIVFNLTNKISKPYEHDGPIIGINFSRDSKCFSFATDPMNRVDRYLLDIVSSDIKYGASAYDHTVNVFVFPQRTLVASFDAGDTIRAITFSRDGKLLAAALDHTTKIYNITQNKLITSIKHTNKARHVTFNQQNNRIAIGFSDGTVAIYKFASETAEDYFNDRLLYAVMLRGSTELPANYKAKTPKKTHIF